jgi:hypothetical protein
MMRLSLFLAAKVLAVGFLMAGDSGSGATNLTLAPDLSFTDDSSANFPIRGENLGDGRIATDRPTAIFLGTAHCWKAERFVALYRKHAGEARYLVVDLDHPSAEQKKIVARFSTGFIPTIAVLDRTGKVIYNRAGETARERGDASALEKILREASSR